MEDRVGNSLLQIWELRFGHNAELLFRPWAQGLVKILSWSSGKILKLEYCSLSLAHSVQKKSVILDLIALSQLSILLTHCQNCQNCRHCQRCQNVNIVKLVNFVNFVNIINIVVNIAVRNFVNIVVKISEQLQNMISNPLIIGHWYHSHFQVLNSKCAVEPKYWAKFCSRSVGKKSGKGSKVWKVWVEILLNLPGNKRRV